MESKDYTKMTFRERRLMREDYVKFQKNKCYYCGGSLRGNPPNEILNKLITWELFPDNFLDSPIHLQHCHKTNMTEGAVHAYCNAIMWQYEGR